MMRTFSQLVRVTFVTLPLSAFVPACGNSTGPLDAARDVLGDPTAVDTAADHPDASPADVPDVLITCNVAGESCTSPLQCCGSGNCVSGHCDTSSCLGPQVYCSRDVECCTPPCVRGMCSGTACSGYGGLCSTTSECCHDLECNSGRCEPVPTPICHSYGQACTTATDCCSGSCSAASCAQVFPSGPTGLAGTVWHTDTIPSGGFSADLTAFSYTIAFDADTSWTATLDQTFSSTAANDAGCTEHWSFSGRGWTVDTTQTPPAFQIMTNIASPVPVSTVTRTGCMDSTLNVTDSPDMTYDGAINGGFESFTIMGSGASSTMATTGSGGVPYDLEPYNFVISM